MIKCENCPVMPMCNSKMKKGFGLFELSLECSHLGKRLGLYIDSYSNYGIKRTTKDYRKLLNFFKISKRKIHEIEDSDW